MSDITIMLNNDLDQLKKSNLAILMLLSLLPAVLYGAFKNYDALL